MTRPVGHGVLQDGSLGEGELFATVEMEYQSKQLQAALLVDTGCDMDMNISEYKAAQLRSPFDNKVELGLSHTGRVQRK